MCMLVCVGVYERVYLDATEWERARSQFVLVQGPCRCISQADRLYMTRR